MSFINLKEKQNITILGDSITFIGHYIAYMKNYLDDNHPSNEISFINLGVSGETLSGLCEADRPTPRGCLFDRIDTILPKLQKADLFIFCYGMNDGIYEPYSDSHMEAYVLGVGRLCEILKGFDKPIVALTPPPFDEKSYFHNQSIQPDPAPDEPIYPIPYKNYDDVLYKYSTWLIGQKDIMVDEVIDIHTPLMAYIDKKRQIDSNYLYGDGIHPGLDGHYIIASQVLVALTKYQMPDIPTNLTQPQ